jgi:hypothetical protein
MDNILLLFCKKIIDKRIPNNLINTYEYHHIIDNINEINYITWGDGFGMHINCKEDVKYKEFFKNKNISLYAYIYCEGVISNIKIKFNLETIHTFNINSTTLNDKFSEALALFKNNNTIDIKDKFIIKAEELFGKNEII